MSALAVEVYKGQAISAIGLAQQLTAIRQSLERGRKGIPDAIAGLELGIDALYAHTEFNRMGQRLYRRALAGTITPKQEKLIRKLSGKK